MEEEEAGNEVFKGVDDVLEQLGSYGRFQLILNVILCMAIIPVFFHPFIMYFLGLQPPWRCVANSSICIQNGSFSSDQNERCFIPRVEWEYTESRDYSIVTQYDINCDREWMLYAATSALFVSWSIGAVIGGWIGDNYGRRVTMLPSVVMIILLSVCSVFSPNIFVFTFIRFLIGFFIPGGSFQLFVCMSEFVTAKSRQLSVTLICSSIPLALGILGIKAYFIRDWKTLMIMCSVPYLPVVALMFFVPESIRWLHLHQKKNDLTKLFKRIAYWNNKVIPPKFLISLPEIELADCKQNMRDLFRPKHVLLTTVLLSYGWIIEAMVYYGLAMTASDLGGSLYLNFVLLTLIDIPANFLARLLSDIFGRRRSVCSCMVFGGFLCITIAFIPHEGGEVSLARVIIGVAGKLCTTMSYLGLLVWSLELYSTNIRSQAIGFFQLMGRVGAAGAPWIVKGLNGSDQVLPFLIMGSGVLIGAFMLSRLRESASPKTSSTGDENSDNENEHILRA